MLLLCLILEHDLRIVRAATRIVVLREELTNMQTTIWHVFRAFDRRFFELNGRHLALWIHSFSPD